jgi:hypothetical protein
VPTARRRRRLAAHHPGLHAPVSLGCVSVLCVVFCVFCVLCCMLCVNARALAYDMAY